MIQQFQLWVDAKKKIESRDSNRHLYLYVHSSIIHKGKMWKQPNCLMGKQSMNG